MTRFTSRSLPGDSGETSLPESDNQGAGAHYRYFILAPAKLNK
jgi:hypothetical protein